MSFSLKKEGSHVKLTWRWLHSSIAKSRRDGTDGQRPQRDYHLGWEWLGPHASFDESTPVQSPPRSGLSTTLSLPQNNALNTKVCSSAPLSYAEAQAASRKARTSHMQGNLHVWF